MNIQTSVSEDFRARKGLYWIGCQRRSDCIPYSIYKLKAPLTVQPFTVQPVRNYPTRKRGILRECTKVVEPQDQMGGLG